MRVAMLGWEFPPFASGGLGVHCYELTRKLAELGVLIDFYMPRCRERPRSLHPNLRIIEVSATTVNPYSGAKTQQLREAYGWSLLDAVASYNRLAVECVLAEIRKGTRYNVVHNHDWLTVAAAGELKMRKELPLVFTMHSTEYDRAPVPWDRLLWTERQGIAQADRVITVSNRMRERMLQMGAPDWKVRVIYNAVDGELYDKYDAWREKHRKIVLFLGRMVEQKGPMQFLYAAKKVSERVPEARFVMAGTGDMLPQLISKSIELGLQDKVIFTGYLSEDEQRKAYAGSDVYVMPSVSEPFGITALEAMASGTPLIISKSSGVGEIVKNVLQVDFWDVDELSAKLIALLKYPALRREMSKEELKEVRKFTWSTTAAKTLEVYKEVAL